MSSLRFVAGIKFIWMGSPYIVQRTLNNSEVRIEQMQTGLVKTEKIDVLVAALFEGEIKFPSFVKDPAIKDDSIKMLELSDYSDKQINTARFRLSVIQPVIEMKKRTKQDVENYVKERNQEHFEENVSVATVYRWLKIYEDNGKDIRSLAPFDRSSESEFGPDVETVIEEVIQEKLLQERSSPQPKKPDAKDVHEEVFLRLEELNATNQFPEILRSPSERTIRRRIADLDPIALYAAQYGTQAARREFTQYGQMPSSQAPLERVEIDHTMLDLIVVDEEDGLPLGRPTFTTLFDTYTKYPIGVYIGFEPPSYYAVKQAMYHAILPKPNVKELYETKNDWQAYGLFDTLAADNAKEFSGLDLQDACLSLGITLEQGPVKMPHFRPGVERTFRTHNTKLFHKIDGTTFSNILERGDYDSLKNSMISLDVLKKIFHIYLVDVYAENIHKGLGGIPARRWEKSIAQGFSPRLPANPEELYILLGRVVYRRLHHYGIQFMNLRYNLLGLNYISTLRARLDGERVKVKYHPDDLSRIHIFDPFERQYIELPSLDPTYTRNLSLWKHREILREARKENKVDIASLGRAKRKINETVAIGRKTTKSTRRLYRARWNEPSKKASDAAPQDITNSSTKTNHDTQMDHLNSLLNNLSDNDWDTGPKLSDIK